MGRRVDMVVARSFPIALVSGVANRGLPVVLVAPSGQARADARSAAEFLDEGGVELIAISDDEQTRARHLNPDHPPGLTKITSTR